jgi:hypothetical protein
MYVCMVLYCIVLHCIVSYCIVLYCIVLYCIVCMYTYVCAYEGIQIVVVLFALRFCLGCMLFCVLYITNVLCMST